MNTTLRRTRKPFQATFSWLLCALILSFITTTLSAKDPTPQQVKLLWVKGKSRYTTDPEYKKWEAIEKGTLIPTGAVIQTADNSRIVLSLVEKQHHTFDHRTSRFDTWTEPLSTLEILESSVVVIDQLSSEKAKHGTLSHTRIDLRSGSISGHLKNLPAKSDYRIITQHFTAKASQAEYLATADGQFFVGTGSALLEVKETNNSSTTATKKLSANLSYDATTDKITPTPTKILRSVEVLDDTEHFRPRSTPPTRPTLRPGI